MTLVILLLFMMITLTLISRQQHILPTLLCLEALTLLLMYFLLSSLNYQMMSMMNPSVVIILTMSVSSASIGLSMLVVTSRKQGNDSAASFSTYSC